MTWRKTAVSPVLMHWRYCSLAPGPKSPYMTSSYSFKCLHFEISLGETDFFHNCIIEKFSWALHGWLWLVNSMVPHWSYHKSGNLIGANFHTMVEYYSLLCNFCGSLSSCVSSFHAWIITPPAQQSCWGVILVSLRPSVCPAVRPSVPHRSCITCPLWSAVTVLVGSISYLYILPSNYRRCVANKVSWKFSKFIFLAISWNL